MQTSTSMLALLTRLVEDHTEPLLAVSMFGFVFLSVLTIINAAQSRTTIRNRTVAYNSAYARAPEACNHRYQLASRMTSKMSQSCCLRSSAGSGPAMKSAFPKSAAN